MTEYYVERGYLVCLNCPLLDCVTIHDRRCPRYGERRGRATAQAYVQQSPIPLPDVLDPPAVQKPHCWSCDHKCIYTSQCAENQRAGVAVLCERVGRRMAGGVLVTL